MVLAIDGLCEVDVRVMLKLKVLIRYCLVW